MVKAVHKVLREASKHDASQIIIIITDAQILYELLASACLWSRIELFLWLHSATQTSYKKLPIL